MPSSPCAIPDRASVRRSCRTCSSASVRPTLRRRACTAVWGSGWQSCGISSSCTGEPSRPTAPAKAMARRSPCVCLACPTDRRSLFLPNLTAAKLTIQLERLADNPDGVGRPEQILDDHLFVLQRFVVFEEAADLAHLVRGELRFVRVVGKGRVLDADGDDLVVEPFLVAHSHDADPAPLDERQRLDRFLAEPAHVRL